MKTAVLFLFFCFSLSFVLGAQINGEGGDSTLLFDYSHVLNAEEQLLLEKKLQEESLYFGGNVMVILTKGKRHMDSVAMHAANTRASEKLIVITADVTKCSYGFFVSDQLKSKFPGWAITKIQDNFIKKNFKDKQYFAGLSQTVDMVSGIAAGDMELDDLKNDTSNSTALILLVALSFFLLVFPIIQYYRMKRNRFTGKPVDFVSSVLLTNTFGTRGKNLFDDFSRGHGKFNDNAMVPRGGIGVEGNW